MDAVLLVHLTLDYPWLFEPLFFSFSLLLFVLLPDDMIMGEEGLDYKYLTQLFDLEFQKDVDHIANDKDHKQVTYAKVGVSYEGHKYSSLVIGVDDHHHYGPDQVGEINFFAK